MKKHLAGAAAIAALTASFSAHAETPGYVDLSLGQWTSDGSDVDTLTIGGAGAVDLSGDWRAQFEGEALRISSGGSAFTFNSLAAHAYYDGGDWAVGGVLASYNLGEASAWSLGAEGQMNVGAFVLEGELGIGTIELFGGSLDTSNANVNATWYATPNFSVAGGYEFSDLEDVTEFSTLSLDAEYKFEGSAFSMFGGYSDYDSDDLDFDSWRIGVRYGFGDDTLQGRRQNGPRWLRGSMPILPVV